MRGISTSSSTESPKSSVKVQGVPFCVQLATLEFAILDMLGTIANKPAGLLIGEMLNPEVSIYLGTSSGRFPQDGAGGVA